MKDEADSGGPWNEGGEWEIIEARELQQGVENLESAAGRRYLRKIDCPQYGFLPR